MKQTFKFAAVTVCALIALSALALTACDKAKPKAFLVEDPFVRATPQSITAGYFAITNKTGQDDALTGITADWAGRAELHNTVKDKDDVLQMVPVETIALPADQEVKLAPGGMHVMLFDVKDGLEVGDTRKVTLHFQHAGPQMIKMKIKPITYKGIDPHAEHH